MFKLSQSMFCSVFSVTFCQKFQNVECLMYEARIKIRTNQYVVKGICKMESRAHNTLEVVLKSFFFFLKVLTKARRDERRWVNI